LRHLPPLPTRRSSDLTSSYPTSTLQYFNTLFIPSNAIQICERFLQTFHEILFTLAEPGAGIVVFLIRLVFSFGVTELTLQVVFVLLVILVYAFPERPLHVGVDVHLDHTVAECFPDLFFRRAAAAVKDEADGPGVGGKAELFCDKGLAVSKNLRTQYNIARTVNTVNITE